MDISEPGLTGDLPGFDDPIGLLRACHEKMQHHCDLLDTLCTAAADDREARAAAQAVLRYFTRSAPLHHRDEEEDIFPHINRQSLKIAELVHGLKQEHTRLDALWTELEAELKRPPEDGFSDAFREAAAAFTALTRQHIGRENRELLPLAANSLSLEMLQVIGESMARRRGVKYSAL